VHHPIPTSSKEARLERVGNHRERQRETALPWANPSLATPDGPRAAYRPLPTMDTRPGEGVSGSPLLLLYARRVDGPVWNLRLSELPYDIAVFPFASPETAMKHGSRWLSRLAGPKTGHRCDADMVIWTWRDCRIRKCQRLQFWIPENQPYVRYAQFQGGGCLATLS
jgi:hypothetical protein